MNTPHPTPVPTLAADLLPPHEPHPREVLEAVAEAWGVPADDIRNGRKRDTRTVKARHAAVVAVMRYCGSSTRAVLARASGLDRATLTYHLRQHRIAKGTCKGRPRGHEVRLARGEPAKCEGWAADARLDGPSEQPPDGGAAQGTPRTAQEATGREVARQVTRTDAGLHEPA